MFNSIVGDDDGGKLFTPEEYEDYKYQKNLELRPRTWSAKERLSEFEKREKKQITKEKTHKEKEGEE